MCNCANRLLIFFYALALMVIRPVLNKKNARNNILLILTETGIGDTICFLDVLRQFPSIVANTRECKVFLAGDESVGYFLTKAKVIPNDVEFIPLKLQGRNEFNSFVHNHKVLANKKWNRIVSLQYMGSYVRLLLLGLDYQQINAVSGGWDSHSIVNRCLNLLLRDLKILEPSPDVMLFRMYEQVLSSFMDHNVSLSFPYIPEIPVETSDISQKPYCVISAGVSGGHANAARVWPVDRFAKIAEFAINELDLQVVICGGPSEYEVSAKMIAAMPEEIQSRVYNIVGKTSIEEWIEITRGAEFVFGNDSGYIHLAAAVRTPSFVVMSYHNYGRVFPYQLNSYQLADWLPIMIEAERPVCAYCDCPWLFEKDEQAKLRKAKCDSMVACVGLYDCVEEISVDMAIETVKSWRVNRKRKKG